MTTLPSARREGAAGEPPARSSTLIVLALMVPVMAGAFESAAVLAAIPRLMQDFQTDAAAVGWVGTAYLLVGAATAATAGRLGDIYGHKRILVLVLAIAAVGSLISLLASSLPLVIVGRAVQGTAIAAVPLCLGAARTLLPAPRIPLAVSLIASSALVFVGAASLVGGILLDNADWHKIFLVAGVVGLLAMLIVLVGVPPTAGMAQRPPIDWFGGVLLAPAIAAVLLGVTQGQAWGWGDARVLTALGLGVLALASWGWWELRAPEPMVNLRLFATRKLILTILATIVVAMGPTAAPAILNALILQGPSSAPVGLGLSATHAGVVLAVASAIAFAMAPISGRISAAVGARSSLMISAALGAATYVGWIVLHKNLAGAQILITLVFTLAVFAQSALPMLIVEAVPKENTGEATAAYVVTSSVFNSVGVSITSVILATSTIPGTQQPTSTAFTACFVFAAALSVIALVLAALNQPASRSGDSKQRDITSAVPPSAGPAPV